MAGQGPSHFSGFAVLKGLTALHLWRLSTMQHLPQLCTYLQWYF